jgi:hypothetical protein
MEKFKGNSGWSVLATVGIGALMTYLTMHFFTSSPPTEVEIKAQYDLKRCTFTNEFVGKNAERLYLCADGIKHKYSHFRNAAAKIKQEQK